MSPTAPMPDARQREEIRRWSRDLEAMPGVAEVLGWEAIEPEGFPDKGRRPEGIYVEIRFRRRGEDPEIWHRLQVGPISPGEGDGADLTCPCGQSYHVLVPTTEEAGKPMTTTTNETDRERAEEAIRLLRILRDREDDPGGKGYLIGAIEATRDGDPVTEEWLEGLRRAVAKGDAS